jgi:hypothetical protein
MMIGWTKNGWKTNKGERVRETDFVDKLICSRIAFHYGTDGLNSLCGTAQFKSSYLKILKD